MIVIYRVELCQGVVCVHVYLTVSWFFGSVCSIIPVVDSIYLFAWFFSLSVTWRVALHRHNTHTHTQSHRPWHTHTHTRTRIHSVHRRPSCVCLYFVKLQYRWWWCNEPEQTISNSVGMSFCSNKSVCGHTPIRSCHKEWVTTFNSHTTACSRSTGGWQWIQVTMWVNNPFFYTET
jgi:hypothetical protein